MEKELTTAARRSIEKKIFEEKEGIYKPNGYTKEFRRECYLEKKVGDEKREKERKASSIFKEYNEFYDQTDEGPPQVYNKKGEVRQLNQGKYEWRFDETPDKTSVVFEIKVPKFMDTQHMNVDLHPDYIRLDIKGKFTQLNIPENILVEKSKVQRSTTTGVLQITMPKALLTQIEAQQLRITRRLEQREQDKKLRALEKKQYEAKEALEKSKKSKKMAEVEDYDNDKFIIREQELESEKQKRLEDKKKKFYEEF
jgi:protein TilB